MAVRTNIYGKGDTVLYEGCVVNTYEHNMAWDSYWYAVCWDRERQELVEIEYDSTACGGGGSAEIDATEEVLREMYRHYRQEGREYFDGVLNEKWAKDFSVGDEVLVTRGRKVPKGTVAKVFWRGQTRNNYTRQMEDRCGVEFAGQRVFLPSEYCQRTDWERHLLHGKARKQAIRNFAINTMPVHFRHLFS